MARMRHHEESLEAPAAAERVTAEELTAALRRIGDRREAELRAGRITIGEAVKDLKLEATPEEILAEVQALRVPVPKKTHRRVAPMVATTVALVLLAFILLAWVRVARRPPIPARPILYVDEARPLVHPAPPPPPAPAPPSPPPVPGR
jgi:hypothetical protein